MARGCGLWPKGGDVTTERHPTRLTVVDILFYIQKHWKEGYKQFPNLSGLSPVQVLARLPEKDARYRVQRRGEGTG